MWGGSRHPPNRNPARCVVRGFLCSYSSWHDARELSGFSGRLPKIYAARTRMKSSGSGIPSGNSFSRRLCCSVMVSPSFRRHSTTPCMSKKVTVCDRWKLRVLNRLSQALPLNSFALPSQKGLSFEANDVKIEFEISVFLLSYHFELLFPA